MAFKRKILRYKEQLYRLALQLLGNRQDAEDAVSDLYMKVLEKDEQFSRYDNLQAALIRSMKNHCINLLKAKKPLQSLEEMPAEPGTSAPDSMWEDDRLALVQAIINDLPDKQKVMIHLRMVEGYTMAQIADVMQEKVNTVEVAISRARKKIRKEYEIRTSS